jgi:mono/diheme cytochrome c family protein
MSRDARRAPSPVVLVLLVTAAASLTLGACGSDGGATKKPQPPALTGAQAGDRQLAQGRAVYAKYCVECHGVRGEGGIAPAIAGGKTAKDFATPAQQADVIEHGRNTMPGFQGILSRSQIDAVVRYEREKL